MPVKVEISINTVELEVKCLYNHLNTAAISLCTSQFGATTSLTLEPITGRKSETDIPRNIDGSRMGKTIRRSRYFAEGEVNIGEYSPRRSRGEYSPIFTSLRRIIVLV